MVLPRRSRPQQALSCTRRLRRRRRAHRRARRRARRRPKPPLQRAVLSPAARLPRARWRTRGWSMRRRPTWRCAGKCLSRWRRAQPRASTSPHRPRVTMMKCRSSLRRPGAAARWRCCSLRRCSRTWPCSSAAFRPPMSTGALLLTTEAPLSPGGWSWWAMPPPPSASSSARSSRRAQPQRCASTRRRSALSLSRMRPLLLPGGAAWLLHLPRTLISRCARATQRSSTSSRC